MAYIFDAAAERGETDILWNVRNGLPMLASVERHLDKRNIAIVEDNTQPDAGEPTAFKLLVLDESLWKHVEFPGGKWNELHNQPLQFRNDNRPAARFLWFHYAFSRLLRQRYGVLGWLRDSNWWKGRMFASPGAYLRRSQLMAIATVLGQSRQYEEMLKEEPFRTFEHSKTQKSKDDEYLMAIDTIQKALLEELVKDEVEESG